MALSHGPRHDRNGLVLHLDPANPKCIVSGSTTCNDLARLGVTGGLVNGLTFSSDAGGSFLLDGTDDYIRIANVPVEMEPNGPVLTVIGAINPADVNGIIVCPSSNGYDNWIMYESSRLYVLFTEIIDVNNRSMYSTSNSVPQNTWTHFAVTMHGTQIRIYINGILNATRNETIRIGTWASQWLIGSRIPSIQFPYEGKIGVLSVYNRELTPEEVKQNYACFRKRYGL